MSAIWKVLKILCALFATMVGTSIVLFLAWYFWGPFIPLPNIPRQKVAYTIQDLNIVLPARPTVFRLTQKGEVLESSDVAKSWKTSDNPSLTLDRVTKTSAYFLKENGSSKAAIELERVEGYSDKVQHLYIHRMNWYGAAVGSAWLGRICDYPCESMRGRRAMALFWKPEMRYAIDLNTQIDANSGWYLFSAVDINNKGQILCWAAKTDARGAEGWKKEERLVLLTPTKTSDSSP